MYNHDLEKEARPSSSRISPEKSKEKELEEKVKEQGMAIAIDVESFEEQFDARKEEKRRRFFSFCSLRLPFFLLIFDFTFIPFSLLFFFLFRCIYWLSLSSFS